MLQSILNLILKYLDPDSAEQLVLDSAREYFNAAPTINDQAMKTAQQV